MAFRDLRDFIDLLEAKGELKRISMEVDPVLEITEISDRTLRAGGPALLFENPKGSKIPLLANLFGNTRRIALAMGQEDISGLRDVGKLLAFLKEPTPPTGWKDLAWELKKEHSRIHYNHFRLFRVLSIYLRPYQFLSPRNSSSLLLPVFYFFQRIPPTSYRAPF